MSATKPQFSHIHPIDQCHWHHSVCLPMFTLLTSLLPVPLSPAPALPALLQPLLSVTFVTSRPCLLAHSLSAPACPLSLSTYAPLQFNRPKATRLANFARCTFHLRKKKRHIRPTIAHRRPLNEFIDTHNNNLSSRPDSYCCARC